MENINKKSAQTTYPVFNRILVSNNLGLFFSFRTGASLVTLMYYHRLFEALPVAHNHSTAPKKMQ